MRTLATVVALLLPAAAWAQATAETPVLAHAVSRAAARPSRTSDASAASMPAIA